MRAKSISILLAMIMGFQALVTGCAVNKAEVNVEAETGVEQKTEKSKEKKAIQTTVKPDEMATYEVQSLDGSVSILAGEHYQSMEMDASGWSGWIALSPEDSSELIMIMQFVKGQESVMVSGFAGMKELVETTNNMSDIVEAELPEIPDLQHEEAYTCNITQESGAKGKGYVVYGETDYAYYTFLYMAGHMSKTEIEHFKMVCESFQESEPQTVVQLPIKGTEYTDTIRWFNTSFAILIGMNRGDQNVYGGFTKNEYTEVLEQEMLEQTWGIVDHESACETVEWLMTEGQRMGYEEMMVELWDYGIDDVPEEEWSEFIQDIFAQEGVELESGRAEIFAKAYAEYMEKGISAFAAWDYSRVMSNASYCYIAGYFTVEEALDYSLETSLETQEMFDSWDSFMESYLLGYEIWSGDDGAIRRDVYEKLNALVDSPYSVNWNLNLEKTW